MSEVTKNDYAFSERDGQDNWVIELKTGPFADTVYCYDRVSLKLPDDADLDDPDVEATLSFQYNILESNQDMEELSLDEDFNTHIGDVLGHILQESFESGDYKVGSKD